MYFKGFGGNKLKNFKQIIAKQISKIINIDEQELTSYIETPKDTKNGDYAFPCFRLAKELRKAPPVIANEIKEKIELTDEIEKVEVAGGYLNFFINKSELAVEVLKEMSEISQYEFEQQIEIIEAAFERSLAFTPYNFISNLTGQPALSLPVYVNEETNLPLGIQLWGPKNSEIELLKVAKEFEEAGQFILPKAYQ